MADDNNDDGDLYDEFGNYIGPELDSSSDEDDEDDDDDDEDEDDDNDEAGGKSAPDDASDVSGDDDGDDDGNGGNSSNQRQSMDLMVVDDENAMTTTADPVNAIVLHEDKEHYPSAEQTFGEGVRTAVLDEDAMDIDTPLVEPVVTKSHHVESTNDDDDGGGDGLPDASNPMKNKSKQIKWIYSDEYLTNVFVSNETTRTRRGIALIGHLHHGKTSLVDMWMESTIVPNSSKSSSNSALTPRWGPKASLEEQGPRYTDILKSEQERQLSLVSTPMTMLLPDTRGKTYCVTLVDCPGHIQFHDESVAALRMVDGAVLVVDAVEGIMMHTELLLKQVVAEGLPMALIISKIDRLLVELRLPPRDAYYKLLHIIESTNQILSRASMGRYPKLCPTKNNVGFASALHGYFFTLSSFTQVYADHHQGGDDDDDDEQPSSALLAGMTTDNFAKKLWGDNYWDPDTNQFYSSPDRCQAVVKDRSFVTFCLEPLYKIYTACLGESEQTVSKLLRSLGVLLRKDQLRSSARPLLRSSLSKFFETSTCGGFVDMVIQHVPFPAAAAKGKISRCYSGPLASSSSSSRSDDTSTKKKDKKLGIVQSMMECNSKGPLMIQVCKLYSSSDGTSFDAFGRIYSGTVQPGQQVKVLGEAYAPHEDDEDMAIATVEAVAIPRGRTRTNVTRAPAGNWVLLRGVDTTISKTATIVGMQQEESQAYNPNDDDDEDDNTPYIFKPLQFPHAGGEAVVKLSLEPLNPAELPKMVEGLRRVSKAYPMVRTRVEESGEHVLFGTGELYLDCVLHDLRHVYADVEVKVADPIVAFRETVVDTSSLKCFAETTNKRNKLTFIAEPLDEGLAERLENGKVKIMDWDQRKLGRYFQSQFGWDLLSSRSVWAFGDSPTVGTNVLFDDTLPSEVDKSLLTPTSSCRSSIVQGFQWATREGPLCEEPVRGTKIKLLDVTLADKPIHRGGGQIIPTSRRTVHSAILTATPRLMEPIYRLQIQCPGEIVDSISTVLKRRRGHIVQDKPISGTLLYNVRGFLPVLDSFGFETDLRTYTQGQAMVHAVFDHWNVVPGDPLDKTILLHPLEPSPPHHLARELLLKTRRRKGLSEDVSINKFFDAGMKESLIMETSK